MYPLDRGRWGPTVRIAHLRDALASRVDLDVIAAYRGARRVELARYAASGRLRGLAGVYVESSSFLPAEADYPFLGLARALGIPVITYIRDAYQLFPEYYPMSSWRRRLAARLFVPAMRALGSVSSCLAFPTRGLAAAVLGSPADDVLLLPPGSPPPVAVPRLPDARRLLFVGNGRVEAQGAPALIAAVERARADGADVELSVVSRPGEEPPGPHPGWLRVTHAEGRGIAALLPETIATVIPRPRGAYNDLALPVKLYDYLSYGRPLLVTPRLEQAAVVRRADAGIVTEDGVAGLGEGILRLSRASSSDVARWSENAHAAARANSWNARASDILRAMTALAR